MDVSAVLAQDDGLEFQLPKHQRRARHLLNLVATVDALQSTSNEAYKKVYRSTFSKCYALWDKCGRSTLAAEAIEEAPFSSCVQTPPDGAGATSPWRDC